MRAGARTLDHPGHGGDGDQGPGAAGRRPASRLEDAVSGPCSRRSTAPSRLDAAVGRCRAAGLASSSVAGQGSFLAALNAHAASLGLSTMPACRCASCRRRRCRQASPTKPTSAPPVACRPATTCTTSSTGWCGRLFPLIKRALNALQAAQIAAAGVARRAGRRATPPPSSSDAACWWCAKARSADALIATCVTTAGSRSCYPPRHLSCAMPSPGCSATR